MSVRMSLKLFHTSSLSYEERPLQSSVFPPLDMLMHCESAHHAWMGPADKIPPGDLAKC